MPKDDMVYVLHMLETARKAVSKVEGKTRAEYDADEDLQIVLTHLVQIIGEAARHVSLEFREAHAAIPWKAIVGMRHKVVHDYLNVDEDILWDTVTNELGPLIAALEGLAPERG
jgi:uncharacterized protein with HEPN domain